MCGTIEGRKPGNYISVNISGSCFLKPYSYS